MLDDTANSDVEVSDDDYQGEEEANFGAIFLIYIDLDAPDVEAMEDDDFLLAQPSRYQG